MSIQTVNPNTNKTLKSFEEMTEKTVDAKIAKAQVATLIRAKKSTLAKTITLEMGKLFGRELSELGIQEFVNKKLIRVNKLNDPF